MNYEQTVGTAIVKVLEECGDADIVAGVGFLFQRPLNTEAQALLDKLGAVAIHAVAQWNLAYAARATH